MALIYDDRDPAVQLSAGDWGQAGVQEEYRGTTSWTETLGATARVSFTGRGIAVYGTITILGDKDRPISTYVIDDDTSNSFRFVGEQVDKIQRLANFYTASGLEYGEHVLTITNEGSNATLYLDYFEISGFDNPGTSSSSSQSPDSDPTPSPSDSTTESGQTSNSPSTPSPSQSNSITILPNRSSSGASQASSTSGLPPSSLPGESAQQSGSNSGPPAGAIAGGVVGGIAIICIAFLVFVLCKRRQKRKNDQDLHDMYSGPHMQPAIQPFDATGHGNYAPSGYGASAAPHTLGSGSLYSAGMMGSARPGYPVHQNPSGYSMPMAAAYNQADAYSTSMRDTSSPVHMSSASMVSGYTGSSGRNLQARTAESQPQLAVTNAGYTGSNKLAANIALTAPNRTAEVDAPPGYQG